MDTKTNTILGINQGTRYLGLAVISGTVLRDWKVKTLKGKWSQAKLKKAMRIMKALIDHYQPTDIAIKRLNSFRSSKSLRTLTMNICKIARIKHVKTFEFSISDLRRHHSGEEAVRNKKQLAEVLASQYPDLYFELEKEKRNRNPYYMRMFEAVALAAMLNDKSFNS
jgi:Holliday junction resolvasome RuvABC endonuclease subunit